MVLTDWAPVVTLPHHEIPMSLSSLESLSESLFKLLIAVAPTISGSSRTSESLATSLKFLGPPNP